LKLRIIVIALSVILCQAATDPVAARLARRAKTAQNSGEVVRAYLLYAEAAARDPKTPSYRENRDALEPAANLLTKADVQSANIEHDINDAMAEAAREKESGPPPIELAKQSDWERGEGLQPLPTLKHSDASIDFNLRGSERMLFEQVAGRYGVRVIFDTQFEPKSDVRFEIAGADFRTAMEALTAVTGTFLFPTSEHEIFVARNTEPKRNEYEPNVLLTFPLPNALEQKDLVEAANAVRGLLTMRTVGWDSVNRVVMIRDRIGRARIARALLESLLLPKSQLAIEVQILTVDSTVAYHYGLALPTSTTLAYLGKPGGFKSLLPSFSSPMTFLAFGGGASLFGMTLANSSLFATYSNSFSRALYDATVVVGGGQTANLHIGDKYPIPQTIYSGFAQQTNSSALYNPIGQVTLEDLGIILKLTPRVMGDNNVSIDVEASYKALGAETIESIPAILQREFKGTLTMREGEWAVLAGLDEQTLSITRNGIAGLAQIPGINQFLGENMRSTEKSKTLLVIKPRVTRAPMSTSLSPRFLLGPVRGERVLL